MKHRTIAICVTGYDYEYESRVVKGVLERCSELDINLLSFSPMTRKLELNSDVTLSESIIKGETEIYKLINFSAIDGLLLMGDSFITRDLIGLLTGKAEEYGVPVVNINDTEQLLRHNILLSDKDAMKLTVRHLIEAHGRKRIGFIGGFPGNIQTEERLEAYKCVLQEHNIPFDERLVTYGEFWKKAAQCAEKLMSLDPEPDAIACASDSMAFFCIDKLSRMGYSVPEEVAVTGFDGIKDCDASTPRLTTVQRDHEKAGVEAVNAMVKIWEGESVPEITYVDSRLIIKESCGCPKDRKKQMDFYSKHYAETNRFKEFNSYTTHSNAVFAGAETSVELFSEMSKGADFFGFRRMFICISPEYERRAFNMNSGEDFTGMTERMLSMVKYGHEVPLLTEFETRNLVPTDILNEEKAVFFAFSPLYFKNRFLGYVAFEPTKIDGEGSLFGIWLMNISHNAGSFYMNKALENLYVRDQLTGLLNRHGMEKYGHELLMQAKAKHTVFGVICADVDRLKPINDTYGHEAGDNAIKQVSIAIRCSMAGNGICIRTGGDEFCVLVAGCTDEAIKDYIHNIGRILEEYNAESGLPYKVSCSCGYAAASADETESIADIINRADERMYDVKAVKRRV